MQPTSPTYPIPPGKGRSRLIITILAVLLVLSVIGNIVIGMNSGNDSVSQAKIDSAVAAAKKQQSDSDAAAAKAPYKTFTGSATYGSITFSYPKNYSAYVDTTNSDTPLNAYFYPDQVPSTTSNSVYALRLELVSTTYADVLAGFQSDIASGTTTATSYLPPKMKSVTNASAGMLLTGPISSENAGAQGTLLVLKVRDKTLKIYTESTSFNSDFNNIVLPSLTFAP